MSLSNTMNTFKGLHGFLNFEKSIFITVFYIIVHVKYIFPEFQVYRSKILGDIFAIHSHLDPYESPFVLNAFFSKLYY